MKKIMTTLVAFLLGATLALTAPAMGTGDHSALKARLDKLERKTSNIDSTGVLFTGTVILPADQRPGCDPNEPAVWQSMGAPLDTFGFVLSCGPRE